MSENMQLLMVRLFNKLIRDHIKVGLLSQKMTLTEGNMSEMTMANAQNIIKASKTQLPFDYVRVHLSLLSRSMNWHC